MTSPQTPITSGASPAQVAADLSPLVDFKETGMPLERLEWLLHERLLPHLIKYDAPGFQSMFNDAPAAAALLGGRMALETNQGVTNWQVSPGGAMLEELCCQALCHLFGLNANAGATFFYSGTYANQQALYLALHRFAERQGFDLAQQGVSGFDQPKKLAVLVSEEAHFSLKHAVRMLGLGEHALIPIPLDENRRADAAALRQIVDEAAGNRDIFCLVATTGTTSTGAVDPIEPFVEACRHIGAWLHLDGAYGYGYKLVSGWRELFAMDLEADSICWDPHKQLGAPIPNSILFLRDQANFQRMALHSGYFNRADDVEPNPGLKSPPSTRPLSALPLITLLRGKGLAQIKAELRSPLAAVRQLAEYLKDQPDFELGHSPDLGILCFRLIKASLTAAELDQLQKEIYRKIMETGSHTISTTTLNGTIFLRIAVVKPTSFAALAENIELARLFAQQHG